MSVWQTDSGRQGMRHDGGPSRCRPGFSLGELIVTIVIGAMILVAVLGIYGRANQAAEAVLKKIESPSLGSEVLQRIAEDLGRTLGADDVSIQIRNGLDNGFQRAELVLRRTFHNRENKEQVLEEITWRAAYDHEGETPGLIIYRSYDGVTQEDKLLDDNRDSWEKNYNFVPICRGVTFFQIQACKEEELSDQWTTPAPPPGVRITLSFAEPYETAGGTRDVVDDEKISRTIVVDAARKIKFNLPAGAESDEGAAPDEQKSDESTSKDQATGERTDPSRTTDERAPAGRMNERTPRERTTNEPTPRETRSRTK